jgi:hypothetical protein
MMMVVVVMMMMDIKNPSSSPVATCTDDGVDDGLALAFCLPVQRALHLVSSMTWTLSCRADRYVSCRAGFR